MRYAIFTDIHANLEALEAVLTKIDELSKEEPVDQIWFLGDLVGYGPNPNECIEILRERTDVIIAGNHDWAAVGKLDLEDFSAAARVSAEWTAEELTEEHREFLRNLPEHLEIGECTLVHGSPYGPLWEYLTSEVLAERSFQHFNSRFCVVGHTHIPVIFQQPYTLANEPTEKLIPLTKETEDEQETSEMASVILTSQKAEMAENAHLEAEQTQYAGEKRAARRPRWRYLNLKRDRQRQHKAKMRYRLRKFQSRKSRESRRQPRCPQTRLERMEIRERRTMSL